MTPETLGYLLFTSGTSGAPKACLCSQGRLARIGAIVAQMYALEPGGRLLPLHAAVPLQRADGRLGPGADGGLGRRPPLVGPLLRLGLPPRRAGGRCDLLQLRREAAVLHSGHARAARRRRQPAGPCLRQRGHDRRRRPLRRALRRRRHRRLRLDRRGRHGAADAGHAAGGAGAGARGHRRARPGHRRRSARRPASTTTAGCSTRRRPSASWCPRRAAPASRATGATARPRRPRLREGWYWTGDLAYRDDAGFFYFAGRDHDWLRVDGENFASAPIERILQRHPDVVLASVYAVPDPVVGDQVMAAVQLRPGLDALDAEESRRPSSPRRATSARSGRPASSA